MEGKITEETFRKTVEQKIREKSLSFILAVYRTFDEFLEREIQSSGMKLACKKGCSLCCHQLITCTEMEIDEVVGYIGKLPRSIRRPLVLRLKRFAKDWLIYYRKNELALILDQFKALKDWHGKPCPFLNK